MRFRWTSADDQALAQTVEDHRDAEALIPVIAHMLGLDPDDLRVVGVYRPKPCRHLKCRVRRWWKRVTR